jgi:hypothetical protein
VPGFTQLVNHADDGCNQKQGYLTLKVITLIILCVALFSNCFGQIEYSKEFIEYKNVIKEIKASKSDLKDRWDYEAILLLDTSYIYKISQIQPDIVRSFRKIFSEPIPVECQARIPIKVKSLKECFNDIKLLNTIYSKSSLFLKTNFIDLQSPIYIKDNRIAVYDIYNGQYERHRMTILNDTLLIEIISTTIE